MRQSGNHRQVATLVEVLKQLFRARGLRYREIAALLGVTERTVKRWFAGSGLTLEIVEDLCNVLGITFLELCEVAEEDLDTRPARLSRDQEQQLFADLQLAFVFILLTHGWTAPEIQRGCNISEAALVGHLVRLERLRLVELLPGNRVRLLYARKIRWADSPEAGRAFSRNLLNLFSKIDLEAPDGLWTAQVVYISPEAAREILAKFQSLGLEIVKSADADRGSPTSKTWHAVFMAAQPFDPLELPREPAR